MANRDPAKCSRAVREAWEYERELVADGKGTRDWTPEQQEDIMAGDTPKDEYGRAYEGHHMRSAEKYPQDQEDPYNVQFLTREEHQAAHDGNFRNPTQSYYDPETGERYDCSDHVVSAPEIELSNPTEVIDVEEEEEPAEEETSSLSQGAEESEDLSEGM